MKREAPLGIPARFLLRQSLRTAHRLLASRPNPEQGLGFGDGTDYFGLSIYPQGSVFMLNRNPAAVPTVADFGTLFALGGKPVAVCETSYPAEPFTAYGGWVATFGTPELQSQFFQNLLAAADPIDMEFIINFVLRDYDALWQDMGSPDDINIFWRDTGFYDENGNERPVLTIWRDKLP